MRNKRVCLTEKKNHARRKPLKIIAVNHHSEAQPTNNYHINSQLTTKGEMCVVELDT